MGQGRSSEKSGKGFAGVAVADGAVAVNCRITGTVPALVGAHDGTGRLRLSGGDVLVVADGEVLASCDPRDPLTARLSGCLRQDFEYLAVVRTDDSGAASVDVRTVP